MSSVAKQMTTHQRRNAPSPEYSHHLGIGLTFNSTRTTRQTAQHRRMNEQAQAVTMLDLTHITRHCNRQHLRALLWEFNQIVGFYPCIAWQFKRLQARPDFAKRPCQTPACGRNTKDLRPRRPEPGLLARRQHAGPQVAVELERDGRGAGKGTIQLAGIQCVRRYRPHAASQPDVQTQQITGRVAYSVVLNYTYLVSEAVKNRAPHQVL